MSDEDDDDVIYAGSTESRARIMLKCAKIYPHATEKSLLKAINEVLNNADIALNRKESFYVASVIDALENASGEAEVILLGYYVVYVRRIFHFAVRCIIVRDNNNTNTPNLP